MGEILEIGENVENIEMDGDMVLTEEEAGFQVDNDQKAEWCLSKIREAEEEKEKWKAFYEDRLKKIVEREDARILFMQEKLKPYFASVPHKVTKTQESYQLPSGKLVLKAQAPEWEHDDEQLLPWVRENVPSLVKVKESVNWAELKKELSVIWKEDGDQQIVNADGLILPGVKVTERPDVFKVEVR